MDLRFSWVLDEGRGGRGGGESTGVGVEQLQELNPQLDPQALVSGQKLKIR